MAAEFKTASALTRIFGGPLADAFLDEYERNLAVRASKAGVEHANQAMKDLATLHMKALDAARADLQV